MLNLQQISDAIHTTAYFGVIHALLGCEDYYKTWRYRFAPVHGANDVLHQERWRWALVQKSPRGLHLLDATMKHEMKRQNVVPNIWVFPPKMGIYVSMVHPEQTSYREAGPKAITNLETNRTSIPTFRGCEVHEANAFDVDFTGQPISLLERERQCGEYWIMEPDENLTIYDATVDDWRTITYAAANTAARQMATDAAGEGEGEGALEGLDGKPTILLMRPHQTWRMSSAILAEGGSKLGSTFHGTHDFVLQVSFHFCANLQPNYILTQTIQKNFSDRRCQECVYGKLHLLFQVSGEAPKVCR